MPAAKAESVTSSRNPLLRDLKKAALRGSLTEDGCCAAEGFHLLEEALRSDCAVKAVVAAESARTAVECRLGERSAIRTLALPDNLFHEMATTENTQGVISLVRPRAWTLGDLFRGHPLVVVLDGLQDPGNAGAIVRAAEAFGATGVMFLKGTASPYNTKTLRASAGSLFRLPHVYGVDAAAARSAFQERQVEVYAAVPRAGPSLDETDLARRCAILIGSEARGISEQLRIGAVELSIPTSGVESLNAAMAAGILLYEAQRQRRRRP